MRNLVGNLPDPFLEDIRRELFAVYAHKSKVEYVQHGIIVALRVLVELPPPLDCPAAYLLRRFLVDVNEVSRFHEPIRPLRRIVERQGKIERVRFREYLYPVVCKNVNLPRKVEIIGGASRPAAILVRSFTAPSRLSVELRPLRAQFPRPELYAKARRKRERIVSVRKADRAASAHKHKASGVAPTRGAEPPINGGRRRVVPILYLAVSCLVIIILRLLVGLVCVRVGDSPENLILRKREKFLRRGGYVGLCGRGAPRIVCVLRNGLEVRAEVGRDDVLERRANCFFMYEPFQPPALVFVVFMRKAAEEPVEL